MNETIVKPGSVLLYKKYGWFKKLLSKIIRRRLPFNAFMMFDEQTYFIFNAISNCILVEPIKAYSKKEATTITNIVGNQQLTDKRDLFVIINAVRPNTFSDTEDQVEKLLHNKYYKIIDINDEANHSEYIY